MKYYDDLDLCVEDLFKELVDYASIGVKANMGGPFGAGIIVKEDNKYRILVVERNNVIQKKDPTAHAEINAIRRACKILDSTFLENCILVSTSRSCPMCLSAAIWARIPTIYYYSDYEEAEKVGFKDNDIYDYISGKNVIIKEIKYDGELENNLFDLWENKPDKIEY